MTDEEQLREYMQTKVGSLHPDRSTASYVLEFLKTADVNREVNAAKYHVLLAAYEVNKTLLDINRMLENVEYWIKRAEKLIK
jgi:Zn-dependent M32 family carboxypeptidase